MLTRIHTVITQGLTPINIDVEVNSVSGIPQIVIIGLVTTAVREAKDRIVTALKHLGIRLKARRTIISLTPADIKKSGSSFDLAMAVGLISLYRNICIPLEKSVFIGEVSLDGSIQPVSNCLTKVLGAQKLGYLNAYIAFENLKDVSLVDGIKVFGIKKLSAVIDGNSNDFFTPKIQKLPKVLSKKPDIHIIGQHEAIRALTIAVAGKHHLHMVGPPGVGKSSLPQLAKVLFPQLNKDEALEVVAIKSLTDTILDAVSTYEAPFRSPHHSITLKKMIGSETNCKPGELSLAHRGILFLDELPLFSSQVIQGLRRPLDDKKIVFTQNNTSDLPCNTMVIAASNPCPCGYWQTGVRSCKCSAMERTLYSKRLSGPLLDRFDLHVTISPLKNSDYSDTNTTHSIEALQKQVLSARDIQEKRYKSLDLYNSDLNISRIESYCSIEKSASEFLNKATTMLNLSTRAYEKVAAVAQTIADLESEPKITQYHCAEALNYRFEHTWSNNVPN